MSVYFTHSISIIILHHKWNKKHVWNSQPPVGNPLCWCWCVQKYNYVSWFIADDAWDIHNIYSFSNFLTPSDYTIHNPRRKSTPSVSKCIWIIRSIQSENMNIIQNSFHLLNYRGKIHSAMTSKCNYNVHSLILLT